MFKWVSSLVRSIANETVDKALERMARDRYTENIFEMIPSVQKVGMVEFGEIMMRSKTGVPAARPLGSYMHFSPWEKLLLNPVHLHHFPTPDHVAIDTSVTIGRHAKKPLKIEIPVMIAAMSFGGALSKNAKVALAKAASRMGTATNTGEAGLMKEEREAASLLIGQYNRGGWLNTPDKYSQVDAIEIQLGQGAQGSSPQRTKAQNIGEDFREVFELKPGEDALIHSRLPGVDSKEDFIALVRRLQAETGVPVGLKIAATHYLERELEIALEAGVDFFTVDGAEGGTHAAAPTLEDDLGLPTLFAVSRASKFLKAKDADRRVSLIATGGLITPGHCLKAMALGADAVYMGTAAVMALVSDQASKVMPFEPPTSLVVYNAKATEQLDVERAAESLYLYLKAVKREFELVCYSMGKTAVTQFSRSDLCAFDPFLAKAIDVDLGYIAPADQSSFYDGLAFPFADAAVQHEEPSPSPNQVH
jgi:glutamate synthase domain-containing protein 2